MANAVEVVIKALDQTKGGISSALKNVSSMQGALVGLGAAAAATAVAFGGAMAVLIKHSIDAASELGSLSKQTGIGVEELSRLTFAARASGVDLEEFTKIVGHANKSLAEAAGNYGSEAAKALRALGISATDASGNLIKADQFILQLSDSFAKYADGPNKVAISMALLGRSGADAIAFLDKGSAKIRELGDSISGVTTEEAAQAKEFKSAMKELNTEISNLGNELAKELLPDLADMAKSFKAFISEKNEDGVNRITAATKLLTGSIRELFQTFESSPFEKSALGGSSVIKGIPESLRAQAAAAAATAPSVKESQSGLKDAPGIFDEEKARKAQELELKIISEGIEGSDALRAKQNEAFSERIRQIQELGVTETQQNELENLAFQAREEMMEKAELQGHYFKADLEEQFNRGSIERTIELYSDKRALAQADLENNRQLIDAYTQQWKIAHQNIKSFAADASTAFSTNFSGALSSIILHTKSVGQAFTDLGKAMISMVVNFVTQWIAARVVTLALGAVFGAAAAKASVAEAVIVSEAWAPAAAFVSLASFGANAVPAGAAIAGVNGLALGLAAASSVGGVAHGGLDYVPQESTYLLQRGEAVLQPAANVALMDFLSNTQQGGPSMVELHIDGEVLGRGIGRISRDGRLVISAKSIS